jgi:PAS domain S-box-containing protein
MNDLYKAYRRVVGGQAERSALITDAQAPDNPIIFVTDAFLAMTGYSRDAVMGHNCRFLQGPDTCPQAIADLRDAIREGRALTRDILNYRRDGTPFWNRLGIRPIRGLDGELHRFVGVQQEIDAWEVWPEAVEGIQT